MRERGDHRLQVPNIAPAAFAWLMRLCRVKLLQRHAVRNIPRYFAILTMEIYAVEAGARKVPVVQCMVSA
jgi:hypothetical protein